MRKICFVTCGALPVPAIKGGAIEQLIELLINEMRELLNSSLQ